MFAHEPIEALIESHHLDLVADGRVDNQAASGAIKVAFDQRT